MAAMPADQMLQCDLIVDL